MTSVLEVPVSDSHGNGVFRARETASTVLYSLAHAWALWWAGQGFRVFRVCGVREVDGFFVGDCWTSKPSKWNAECWPRQATLDKCQHPKPGKSPFVKSWKAEATTDRATINGWFRESPYANYAVVIEPGYVVLDFDTPDDKHEWRDGHQEVAALGELPPTLTFQTGSGGEHRLFRTSHDNGCSLPAFEGLHMKGIVDVKAYGLGYIIGTGSRHHSGGYYTCPDLDAEIACAPEWLYDHRLPRRRSRSGRTERQALVEAGQTLHDAYVEDPDATLSWTTLKRLGLGKAGGTERYDDEDQSLVTFRIVMGAIRVNYPLKQLFGLLRRGDSLGGLGLRKRINEIGFVAAQEWLDDMVEQAFFYLATNQASVRKLKAEAKRTQFTKTAYIDRDGNRAVCNGESIRKVLMAFLDIADKRQTLDPMVGVWYQLTKATKLEPITCRKALQALEALGWITGPEVVLSSDGMTNAYKYRLLTDPTSRTDPPGIASKPRKESKEMIRSATVASQS